jgi:hypothetical protein
MTFAVRTVVNTNCGVTLREVARWITGPGGCRIMWINPKSGRPDGRIHRVAEKRSKSARCAKSKTIENSFERNLSSPINLQFTVHLNRNTRVSSNAREKYPAALTGRNGNDISTYDVRLV